MKATFVEDRRRRFIAQASNLQERKAANAAGRPEPAEQHGHIEVRIQQDSPRSWAAGVLRAIADQLEQGG